MRKIQLLVALLFMLVSSYAQQEAQYTQFMYNKLTLNPAYAGSAGQPCISCLHRSQWIGFEGAPSSQVVNFHMPAFSKKVGFGASLSHDKIGPTHSYSTALMYAYRIKLKKGILNIGLRTSLRFYQVNWTDLEATHGGDTDIPTTNTSRLLPNFGTGIYYENEKFYAGISTPNILNNDLSHDYLISNSDLGRSRRHLYLMSAYLFKVSGNVKFKPAVLVKYVHNSPVDADLNASFIFMDKLWTGLSYRFGGDAYNGIGESVDLLIQYQISPSIRAGAAYDFTLSKIRNHSSGTVELQLEYCIQPKKEKPVSNPRFF